MRHLIASMTALALAGGVAFAQYKTPQLPPSPQTTTAPPIGSPTQALTPNPAVQITPTSPLEASMDNARRITREEAIKMVKEKKAVYIDVRPKDQYEIEHIKGAISIPLSDLPAHFKALPANKFLITYCA